MRIAVASCWKYRDVWPAFFQLFRKFWPDCHFPVWLITDRYEEGATVDVPVFVANTSWCGALSRFAEFSGDDDILLMQDDHLLNAPVRLDLMLFALEQMKSRNAGMVRLYPCPGANEDYGHPKVGLVTRGTLYRVSCQVSVWRSDFLRAIASQFGTPQEFELQGSPLSDTLPDDVLAWKRDEVPTPISYEVTAVVSGKWTQSALELCRTHGVNVDRSMRECQSA